ncbi:hypothetical protein H0H92_000683 [Tricholoma furcatifolium]|nr:hypothetical protein H0H92_000683 [Tricholoma furcatifolium]
MGRLSIDHCLDNHGYKAGDIVLLSDDSTNPRQQPTRQNILDAMHWLVRGAKPHDSLFFHYSGHGGQTKDLNGDEIDGFDEVIFPVDFQTTSHIIDDDMHEIMIDAQDIRLDLPYVYSSHGRLKGSQVTPSWQQRLSTSADVISLSGCDDAETSADTFTGGKAVGAMSNAFIQALSAFVRALSLMDWRLNALNTADNPTQSYHELLTRIRRILSPRFSQKPQLGSSHHIDTSLQFIL